MLQILIDDKYPLDLPSDISLDIIQENPLFLEERIPAPYSLSFEIPPTLSNLQYFGYANRVTSSSVNRRRKAGVKHFGILIARGEVLLLEFDKKLKLQFKGSLEHENVTASLNELNLGSYNYGEFPYNYEDLDYNNQWADVYMQSVKSEAYNAANYVVAPVKIKGTEWEGSLMQGGARNFLKQYINYFNPVLKNFYVGNPAHIHTPIVPFPYVHKIITEGFGNLLLNNPFTGGDLAKLVVVSQNHRYMSYQNIYQTYYQYVSPGTPDQLVEVFIPLVDNYTSYYSPNAGRFVIALEMIVKSFMQSYPFISLLKNLLKMFGLTAYPGTKYSLEFNNDIFDRAVVKDLNDRLAGDIQTSYQDGKDFVFSYAGAGTSSDDILLQKSNIIDVYNYAKSGMVTEAEILDLKSKAIFETKKTLRGLNNEVLVKSTIKRSAFTTQSTGSDKEKFEITPEVSPLDMNIEQYWSDDSNPGDVISQKHWYVPVLENKEVTATPSVMLFGGMAKTLDDNNHEYPFLTASNYDHFGVKRLNTSLLPDGADGLISKYHGKYKNWVEKDKTRVKGNFRLTPLEVKNLDIRDKILLKGRLFYIEKMEYSLMHKGISLIEMDLIEV